MQSVPVPAQSFATGLQSLASGADVSPVPLAQTQMFPRADFVPQPGFTQAATPVPLTAQQQGLTYPQSGTGWMGWAASLANSGISAVSSLANAADINFSDGRTSWAELALFATPVVAAAGYAAYQKWYAGTPGFDRYTQCPEPGQVSFKACMDAKDPACKPRCISIAELTQCSSRIFGHSKNGYLYCGEARRRGGSSDVDYTDKIKVLLAEMTQAGAAATTQQVKEAQAKAAAIRQREVEEKAKIADGGSAQVQQIVQQSQAAGQALVQAAQKLGDEAAVLQQRQAQTSNVQEKAALQAQISDKEAALKQEAAKFVATETNATAAIQQVQSNVAQQTAATEAKTDAAAAQLSAAVPLAVNRPGSTKLAHRGTLTTIQKVRALVARRAAVGQRVSPPKPVPKRRRVKIVGGQYAYYVPAVRAKRCKKGFKVGKSRKGKRTCRSVDN
jgi:hypothetical protein